MEAITINSTEQIKDLTQQLEKDATWFEDKQIQLADEFPVISIHFIGDKFDSTITTGIMRSILCLQNAIYRSYYMPMGNLHDYLSKNVLRLNYVLELIMVHLLLI